MKVEEARRFDNSGKRVLVRCNKTGVAVWVVHWQLNMVRDENEMVWGCKSNVSDKGQYVFVKDLEEVK